MSNDCIKCHGFGVLGWLFWQRTCDHCGGRGYEPAPTYDRPPLPPPPPPKKYYCPSPPPPDCCRR